jgi:excisionase family DNA binding protein
MPNNLSNNSYDQKRALRVNEASALYGISRSTIYKIMAEGTLRTVKIGGRRLIPRDAIESLISVDTNKGAKAKE